MSKKEQLKFDVILLLCLGIFFISDRAKAQVPFDCTPAFYQSLGDSLSLLDTETNTYIKIGGPFEDSIDAIGYNVLDNYIYGIGQGTLVNKLIRIDASGTLEIMADVGISAIAGDMDRSGNLMLITAGQISEIKVTAPFIVTNHPIANMPSSIPHDIVYIPSTGDDIFYGLGIVAGVVHLYEFNLITGLTTVTTIADSPGTVLPDNGNFSATWVDMDNNLYVRHDESGEIFLIENYTKDSLFALSIAITPKTPSNDGASCPYAKNPLTSDIGDYIWNDVNHNGIQDDSFRGDPSNGLSSVKVTLFDEYGNELDSTYTDSNGLYKFYQLLPGDYSIAVNKSAFVTRDYPTFDYDGVKTPYTADFTLSIASHQLDIDFCFSDFPLPVNLNAFHAEVKNGGVRLYWTTESEVENQGFFIERKLEAESEWQEISSYLTNPGLRGQGSITHRTEYEYNDSTALSGLTYEYRLSDVDYNTAKFYYNNLTIRIEVNYTAIPGKFLLQPAYPNPFNPVTTITYVIPATSPVKLYIYDIIGNLVRKLVNNIENPGKKQVVWDGRNEKGIEVHSGMYFYSLKAGNYNESKKILLIR